METKQIIFTGCTYLGYRLNNDSDVFEELIDKLILDGIPGMNDTFRIAINSLSKKDKRMSILSILENKQNSFKNIKSLTENNINKVDHISEIVTLIREYVKVGEVEVKKYGEVMTPLTLVEEMLNTLPEHVWTNPNLKWLDPANGVGTFPVVIVQRLMKSLESWEPDNEKRYKHIIENMIYVCELQPKNMFLYMCAFDPKNEYKLNIYCGSFLEIGFDYHMKEIWKVDNFDIIVGNSPYQIQKEGNTKTHTLWDKFVQKSFTHLVDGGYLVMVHPDGWRAVDGMFKDIQKLMTNKQMLYLEIHNKNDGIMTFGAATTYDFYSIKNLPNNGHITEVKCSDGSIENVNLSKMEFIPNGMFSEFERLIVKNDEEKVKMISNSSYHHQRPHMSKQQNDEFKYPCVYTILKDGTINLRYSNINDKGHFNIPKVIWTNGVSTPIVDINGDYGLTEFAYAIIDEPQNLPLIQKAMLSDKFIKIMSFSDGVTGTGHRYNRKAISTFRKDFWKEFVDENGNII